MGSMGEGAERGRRTPTNATGRLLIVGVVLIITTLAGARPAAASCAYTADDESTVVFVGVATDVHREDEPFGLAAAASTFLVEAWEDGSSEPRAVVRTNVAGVERGDERTGGVADARPVVVRGDRWIVHAHPGADGVLDAACSESARLAVGIPTPTSNATRWAIPLTLLALALIGAGAGFVVGARRRQRVDAAPTP